MKELPYYINDVRLATDNTDENGVKDREIIRYFNDGIKSIQGIIFKNNPLCSYFQASAEYAPASGSREYDLPSDCFALNAVTRVEVKSGSGWVNLERAWPEDGIFGWYTSGKKIILTGDEATSYSDTIRVHYFQRHPRLGLSVTRLSAKASATLTVMDDLTSKGTELLKQENALTVIDRFGEIVQSLKVSGIDASTIFVSTFDGSATLSALDGITLGSSSGAHYVVWGKNASYLIDLPEEVEPYLLDYVAKRIYGRNNYGMEASKQEMFTLEQRNDMTAIFADAGQATMRTPITDTEFMAV